MKGFSSIEEPSRKFEKEEAPDAAARRRHEEEVARELELIKAGEEEKEGEASPETRRNFREQYQIWEIEEKEKREGKPQGDIAKVRRALFMAEDFGDLRLEGFETLKPEVLEFLLGLGDPFPFPGSLLELPDLQTLSPESARLLVKLSWWFTRISFGKFENIPLETAKILGELGGRIDYPALKDSVDPAVVEALTSNPDSVIYFKFKRISKDLARALVKNKIERLHIGPADELEPGARSILDSYEGRMYRW